MVKIFSLVFMITGLFFSAGAQANDKEENPCIEQACEENKNLEFAREMLAAGTVLSGFGLILKYFTPTSCEEALGYYYSINTIPDSIYIGGIGLLSVALIAGAKEVIKVYCYGEEDPDAIAKSHQ
jgi:hypothetical protein